MKDRSRANRGQPHEEFIKYANARYKLLKKAVLNKQATEFIPIRNEKGKIVNVKVEEKATVDFIGRLFNIPIAVEAKHTSSATIRFDAVEEHQKEYMDAFTEEPGTIGIVVVSFGLNRFFAIPWAFWKAAYEARVAPGPARKAPVTVEAFGQTWTIPPKASARVEDLNPEWEVSGHDATYGLHYLANAIHYRTPKHKTTTEEKQP